MSGDLGRGGRGEVWGGGGRIGISGMEDFFPDLVAGGLGLAGVDENDVFAEGFFKNLDKLGGEGDFWHEQNSGFLLFEGI